MKKSVVLVFVMGIILVITILSLATFHLHIQQGYITENKIRRVRGFYAAWAGMVYALDQLRQGSNPAGTANLQIGDPTGTDPYPGYPVGGINPVIIVEDPDPDGVSDKKVSVTVSLYP
ncbi:MAG: hypothetical protein ABH858_05010 [Candidatus Omnitrophota bacterium]